MHLNLLDFQFLVILNLFIGILWPASGYFFAPREAGTPRWNGNAASVIVTVLTALALLLDIVFLAIRLV